MAPRSVQISRRIFADQLSPVLAYRRLVRPDERTAPSFLFESVEQGGSVGRYSFIGIQPSVEVLARGTALQVVQDGRIRDCSGRDPFEVLREIASEHCPIDRPGQIDPPPVFRGGWVGYAGYDTARWAEPGKLTFEHAPVDDRQLPDLHMALYGRVLVFDHVGKTVHLIATELIDGHGSHPAAVAAAEAGVEQLVEALVDHDINLPPGRIDLDPSQPPSPPDRSSMTRTEFESAVERAREYIAAGDVFQVVLSQRFERETQADPFDLYRALRVVNPSPYQIYLQARDCMLVAASPEILCRVHDGVVVNRPLAGTRRRGRDEAEDLAMEKELLADEKERAEHVMLLDLGRNDLGRVCDVGSINIDRAMEIERYSHVMHIGSVVTGRLREDLDGLDALRATLPVGTVSGAPKIRAMQVIDELEPVRRGPYAGGIGAIDLEGDLDIAIALRTMVIPTGAGTAPWTVHVQAGAGVVLDSVPEAEYRETVNKAAALGRAIDLAERAFT